VSEFVLESAPSRPDETPADWRAFWLNATQWKVFLAALDTPPHLERLLRKPGFFDS